MARKYIIGSCEATGKTVALSLGDIMVDGEAGKGDTYRKVDMKKWAKNWDLAFGKKINKKVPKGKQRKR